MGGMENKVFSICILLTVFSSKDGFCRGIYGLYFQQFFLVDISVEDALDKAWCVWDYNLRHLPGGKLCPAAGDYRGPTWWRHPLLKTEDQDAHVCE